MLGFVPQSPHAFRRKATGTQSLPNLLLLTKNKLPIFRSASILLAFEHQRARRSHYKFWWYLKNWMSLTAVNPSDTMQNLLNISKIKIVTFNCCQLARFILTLDRAIAYEFFVSATIFLSGDSAA